MSQDIPNTIHYPHDIMVTSRVTMTISKSRGGVKMVVKSELRLRKYKVIIQESVHHIDASSKSRYYPDKFTVVKNIPALQNIKQQRSF